MNVVMMSYTIGVGDGVFYLQSIVQIIWNRVWNNYCYLKYNIHNTDKKENNISTYQINDVINHFPFYWYIWFTNIHKYNWKNEKNVVLLFKIEINTIQHTTRVFIIVQNVIKKWVKPEKK